MADGDPQVAAAALEAAMLKAADELRFEEAAMLRDELHALQAAVGQDPVVAADAGTSLR